MRQTLIEAHIPIPALNAAFVSTVELGCGLLSFSAHSRPLCVILTSVMIVANAATAARSIKATSLLSWLSEFFYLPELLCLVIFLWLFLSDPGWLNIDHLILSKIHL